MSPFHYDPMASINLIYVFFHHLTYNRYRESIWHGLWGSEYMSTDGPPLKSSAFYHIVV